MGVLHWTGIASAPYSCQLAVIYFKTVSERHSTDKLSHYLASAAAHEGRALEATLRYMEIANRGDSSALLNLAMLLDKERPLDVSELALSRDIADLTAHMQKVVNVENF